MKSLMTLVALILIAGTASAQDLKAGTYVGQNKSKNDFYLMLVDATTYGRVGSFIALYYQEDGVRQMALYVMDPRDRGGGYSLTPMKVLNDGVIGIENDDPSLVAIPVKNGDNVDIRLMDSNSSNNLGIQEPVVIRKADSEQSKRYVWRRMFTAADGDRGSNLGGTYYLQGTNKSSEISIAISNIVNGEASALMLGRADGEYIIRENKPYMYLLSALKTVRSGVEVNLYPDKIGIFVDRKARGLSLFLLQPGQPRNILEYVRK